MSRLSITGVLLGGLLLAGCAPDPAVQSAAQKEARQRFESMMNHAVGTSTYEDILLKFGPPIRKQETASSITGVWEEPSMKGERVQMIFDRKTQLLKSWNFQSQSGLDQGN